MDIARRALGTDGVVEQRDLRELGFPQGCAAVALIDVLLYLPEPERVLRAAADALAPDGALLVREPDASGGLAFQLTRLSARFDAATRGRFGGLHYRSATEWHAQLTALGLSVEARPMSERTPFANVLFVARKS